MLPWGSVALGHSSLALPPASRWLPSQAFAAFGSRRGDRPPRVSIRSRGAALLDPKIDWSRNPFAIFAPRFRSARFEPQRPGLTPNGPGNITVPELRSKGRPSSSPRGLAEGISVPDSGRHPTLDGSIRLPVEACQTIARNRVTWSMVGGASGWKAAVWSARAKPADHQNVPNPGPPCACRTPNIPPTPSAQHRAISPRIVPGLSTGNSHRRAGSAPAIAGWPRTRRASTARPFAARRARPAERSGSG